MRVSLRHFRTVMGGDVVSKALTAVFVLSLVRFLPPEGLASFVYLSSLVILSSLLLGGFFNRLYILQGDEQVSARGFRRLQVGTAALIYAAVVVVVRPQATYFELAAGLACTSAAAAFDFSRTWMQSRAEFTRYVAADMWRAMVLLLLVAPVLFGLRSDQAGAVLAAQALAFVLGTLFSPTLPRDPEGVDLPVLVAARRVFGNRGAPALIGYFALVALFGQLPVILLERLADAQALASFGSAYRYYGLLLGISAAANVVILQRVAGSRDADAAAALRSALHIMAAALALALLAGVVGYFAIPLIDAGKYPRAPLLFAVASLGLVPGLLSGVLVAVCLRAGRFSRLFVAQLLSVATVIATIQFWRADPALAAAASLPAGVLVQLGWLGASWRWDAAETSR
jgi:O-antigen/teichoic acid export membrane protein